jgi:hypothetical protein
MRYSMIAYILLCIVVGLTLFQKLNASGRTWSAILAVILFILIFVFYGMRWFGENPASIYKGVWPPIINMCPDYLVYYKNAGKDTCVDMLGVNRSGGVLRSWTKEDSPQNPPADPEKYFNYVYKPGMTESQLKALCKATMDAGLTWEGITNGESCTFTPPSKVENVA